MSGKVLLATNNINEFDNEGNNISTNRLKVGGIELSIGREFGTWGEGRFGYRRATGEVEVKTGTPQPDYDVDIGEVFLRLFADEFDNLHFPREAYLGKVEYRASREDYGASADYDQWLFGYSQAISWSKNTVVGTIAGATTEDDNAPLEGLFELGGFLLISGLEEDQLSGQHVGLVRLVYYRQLRDDGFLNLFEPISAPVWKPVTPGRIQMTFPLTTRYRRAACSWVSIHLSVLYICRLRSHRYR